MKEDMEEEIKIFVFLYRVIEIFIRITEVKCKKLNQTRKIKNFYIFIPWLWSKFLLKS